MSLGTVFKKLPMRLVEIYKSLFSTSSKLLLAFEGRRLEGFSTNSSLMQKTLDEELVENPSNLLPSNANNNFDEVENNDL
jgi:hypothetical protein